MWDSKEQSKNPQKVLEVGAETTPKSVEATSSPMVQKIKKRLSVKALVNLLVAVVLLLLLITAIIVFNRYAQEQLYQESVNQLTEISAQLFEKLEVQLDIQWDYLAKTDDQPKTTDSMTSAQFPQFGVP